MIIDFITDYWRIIPAFIAVITVVVFVHEYGHYIVGRWCGVRANVFSIGFGKELFGWTDKNNCRWKVCAIPVGGYVKFAGDAGAASNPAQNQDEMSAAEKAESFHHKSLPRRAAVVFAGPLANYLFAIAALALLFIFLGQAHTPPVASEVVPQSAAAAAGFKPGDRVLAVDGGKINSFEELRQIVMVGLDDPLDMIVSRDGAEVHLSVTPKIIEMKDNEGNIHRIGQLGIRSTKKEFREHNLLSAVGAAVNQTIFITKASLTGIGQMISGARDASELTGPIGIIKMSGDAAKRGETLAENLLNLFDFMILISISLGFINLLPIPVLDGGHLLFYLIEAVRGKPLSEKATDFSFRIGLTLVLMLMVFATWNDLGKMWMGIFG